MIARYSKTVQGLNDAPALIMAASSGLIMPEHIRVTVEIKIPDPESGEIMSTVTAVLSPDHLAFEGVAELAAYISDGAHELFSAAALDVADAAAAVAREAADRRDPPSVEANTKTIHDMLGVAAEDVV